MNIGNSKERILVISDLQAPATHVDAVDFLAYLKKKLKPTKVVCIGDAWDAHNLSKFVKEPEAPSLIEEVRQAREILSKVTKLFPKCEHILGNHPRRLELRAAEVGIPKSFLKTYNEILGLPDGWTLREYSVEIEDILFVHGDALPRNPKGALGKAFQSVVYGHHCQEIGTTFKATHQGLYFAMSVGALVDKHHLFSRYAKHFVDQPILSVGFVDKGVPRVLPMLLNKNGRWIRNEL